MSSVKEHICEHWRDVTLPRSNGGAGPRQEKRAKDLRPLTQPGAEVPLLFLFQIPQNRLRRALRGNVSTQPPAGKTYGKAQKGAQNMATQGNSWQKSANVNQETFTKTPAPVIKTAISPRVNKSEVCFLLTYLTKLLV